MKTNNTIEKDLERITISVRIPRYLKVFTDKQGINISHIVEKEVMKMYVYEILKPNKVKNQKVLK